MTYFKCTKAHKEYRPIYASSGLRNTTSPMEFKPLCTGPSYVPVLSSQREGQSRISYLSSHLLIPLIIHLLQTCIIKNKKIIVYVHFSAFQKWCLRVLVCIPHVWIFCNSFCHSTVCVHESPTWMRLVVVRSPSWMNCLSTTVHECTTRHVSILLWPDISLSLFNHCKQ